jgi:hypothetical protein
MLDLDKNADQKQMRNFYTSPTEAGFSDAQRRRMRLEFQRNLQLSRGIKGEVQELITKQRAQRRQVSVGFGCLLPSRVRCWEVSVGCC